MVVAGPASNPTFLACGPRTVTGPLTAGQDVFLLVFGDGTTPETSGTMVLTVTPAAPGPTVSITVDPQGSFAHDGSASIHGTLTCTGDGIIRLGSTLFWPGSMPPPWLCSWSAPGISTLFSEVPGSTPSISWLQR